MQETVYAIDRESYNCGYEFDRAPGILENVAQTIKAVGGAQYAMQGRRVRYAKNSLLRRKAILRMARR